MVHDVRIRNNLFVVVFVVLILALGSLGSSYAITNGQPDGDEHTYVGLVVFDVMGVPAWRCSGALISPTVVLTAGHCTDGADAARVWFDEVVEGNLEYPYGGSTSTEGTPYTHPDFCIGCGKGLPGFALRDVGVVVLDEPVYVADDYAELPEPGLVDTLKNKTDIDLVGYGVQEQNHGGGPPTWSGLRNRLYAPSELIAAKFVHSNEFIRITLNPGGGTGGTCFGDSGGPNLLRDTNTIMAVNSYVTNYNCRGVGYSSRIDIPEVLAWIDEFRSPVIINEIMNNPAAVTDSNGEWFELYNRTDSAIDINGWTIKDNDSDSHVIDNGGALIIPSDGYLVLGKNEVFATNGGVVIDYLYPSTGWYLSNSVDEVVLLDDSMVEIDCVEYDGGPLFPDPNGASMALRDPALDNNVGLNWCTASTQWDSEDMGTPGDENDCL